MNTNGDILNKNILTLSVFKKYEAHTIYLMLLIRSWDNGTEQADRKESRY